MKSSHLEQIEKFKQQIILYQNGELEPTEGIIGYFNGIPSKKQYERYVNELIKQENNIVNSISKSYTINVNFSHISKELLEFHNSLNPRITFGYSNVLDEECDFELNNNVKNAFLNASLKELPAWEQDWTHDWGYVFFDSIINLFYEDLCVFRGDRCILETTLRDLAEQTPLGRLGTPEDVAHAVAFFASERASFLTGQVLAADGGFIV